MNIRKTGSTVITRVACAIVFITFTFLFVYKYQATTLEYLQHVLAEGKTHYDSLIGGVVITLLVQVLQMVVYRYHRLSDASYSLTYLPSMLLLALLTDIRICDDGTITPGTFLYLSPLVIAFYFLAVRLALQWIRLPQKGGGPLATVELLLNLIIMTAMISTVCALANGDRKFHNSMKTERAYATGDIDKVIAMTEGATEADTTLTLYRCLALDAHKTLGDSLFYAPVAGSKDALYNLKGVRTYITNATMLRRKRHSADYALCALLLNRDVNGFARQLVKTYTVNDSLPQHYREALIIHQYHNANPVTYYQNELMEAGYDSLMHMRNRNVAIYDRNSPFYNNYKKTYWAYYLDH